MYKFYLVPTVEKIHPSYLPLDDKDCLSFPICFSLWVLTESAFNIPISTNSLFKAI